VVSRRNRGGAVLRPPLRKLRDPYLVIDRAPESSGRFAHVLAVRVHFEIRIATEFILDLFDDFLKQHPRAFVVVGRFEDSCAPSTFSVMSCAFVMRPGRSPTRSRPSSTMMAAATTPISTRSR